MGCIHSRFLRRGITLIELPILLTVLFLLIVGIATTARWLYQWSPPAFHAAAVLLALLFGAWIFGSVHAHNAEIARLSRLHPLTTGMTWPVFTDPPDPVPAGPHSPAPPTLEGRAVLLRPINPAADATDYHKLDPAAGDWVRGATDHRFLSRRHVRGDLERLSALPQSTAWAVHDRQNNRMVGWIALSLSPGGERRVGLSLRLHWIQFPNDSARPLEETDVLSESVDLAIQYATTALNASAIECETWDWMRSIHRWLAFRGFKEIKRRSSYDDEHRLAREIIAFRLTK